MLQLIAGDNTVGKTRYLDYIYEHTPVGDCVYNNAFGASMTVPVNYDVVDKLFSATLGSGRVLNFRDLDVDDPIHVSTIYNLLCRKTKTVLLDEIDLPLSSADKFEVYSTLFKAKNYMQIVAVTHDEELMPFADEFYTVRWNGSKPVETQLTNEAFVKEIYCDEEMAAF